ncbi:interleukin-13 isoform X2 [Talpa occidentalis]|uniref:interleukin-13 isoform X2 n=1 Tax=Talpa occidentalis TaxID=50954 RepID=UPI00188F710C|nr:interleukin-13 isoform X2 [Talpa occidentalis]
MALWLTVVLALTCLGGLTSPSSVPSSKTLKEDQLRELIMELSNITQNPKVPLCNGSMVWSVNLTADVQFCAVVESLKNVSNCTAIRRTRRMLDKFCPPPKDRGSSTLVRDTKIEVIQFAKNLLTHLKKLFRHSRK